MWLGRGGRFECSIETTLVRRAPGVGCVYATPKGRDARALEPIMLDHCEAVTKLRRGDFGSILLLVRLLTPTHKRH